MRQHLAWPHFHPPGKGTAPAPALAGTDSQDTHLPSSGERWQIFKDKLAVAAVLLLVLATLTVFVLYLVQQAPHFASGELTAFATPAPSLAAQTTANATAATPPNSQAAGGLGRIPLILISTVVEMGIFVALGLYLKHDMKRMP